MGGACSTYRLKSTMCMLLGRKPEGGRHVGRPSIDGRIILKCFLNT
jgi:hypothetical protein